MVVGPIIVVCHAFMSMGKQPFHGLFPFGFALALSFAFASRSELFFLLFIVSGVHKGLG